MADQKITDLTAATTTVSTDLLYLGRSPFGATDDRKITVEDFFSDIPVDLSFTAAKSIIMPDNTAIAAFEIKDAGGFQFLGFDSSNSGPYMRVLGMVDMAENTWTFYRDTNTFKIPDNKSLGVFKIEGMDSYSYLQIGTVDGAEQISLMGSHAFSNGILSTTNSGGAGSYFLGSTASDAPYASVATITFTGIDDAVSPNTVAYARENVMQLDTTSGAEYGHWSLSVVRDGDDSETALEFFNLSPITAGAIDFDQFSIGSGSVGLIVSPAQPETVGLPFALVGQEGAAVESGAGNNGGNTWIGSGAGSDAATGDTDGGDSGALYISSAYGGAASGGGAAGTVGTTYIGFIDFSELDLPFSDVESQVVIGNNKFSFDPTNVTYSTGGMTTKEAAVSLDDDATITLAADVGGFLTVWTEAEYIQVHVNTDGAISGINGSANSATTDSDGDLCAYDGGTGVVIKNRLGSTKTVRYFYKYA